MIDNKAFFTLSYGLFLISCKSDGKDNACIINTCIQVTDSPKTVCFAINKNNLTHDMLLKESAFNINVLSEDAPFSLFERFGMNSGRNMNKFDGVDFATRSITGVFYLNKYSNSLLCGYVSKTVDCGTHTLFFAEITIAETLSQTPSMTYDFYFKNVKPKPQTKAKGFVCKICGYVLNSDTLPDDFICPLCKHPASDFEKIE